MPEPQGAQPHSTHRTIRQYLSCSFDLSSGNPPIPIPSDNPTVSELLVRYLEWAQGYYDAREYGHFVIVAQWLRQHFGPTPAQEFGPLALKTIRQAMIEHGWTRKGINRQVVRVRQIFSWAVSEEIISAVNLEALRAVKGLREGRSDAREKDPIQLVEDAVVEATLKHLSSKVADMVKVHRLIGCRPADLVAMRPDLIDRSGQVWIYSPASHKTTWRGKSRKIAIGPRAQAILKRYLFGEWCFVSQTDHGRPETYLTSCLSRLTLPVATVARRWGRYSNAHALASVATSWQVRSN